MTSLAEMECMLRFAITIVLSLATIVVGIDLSFGRADAQAEMIKITNATQHYFKLLDQKSGLTCYNPLNAAPRLGTVASKRIKAGAKWSAENYSALTSKLASLKKKGSRKKLFKKFKKPIAVLTKKIAAFDRVRTQCSVSIDAGEPQSLAPYQETLSLEEVRYLLNKVAFGGSSTLEAIGVQQGLSALVNAIVESDTTQAASLDQKATTWAEYARHRNDKGELQWTVEAVQAGQMYRFLHSQSPFQEWMWMFLHAHFATNLREIGFAFDTDEGGGIPDHWRLLHKFSTGNFGALLKELLLDSAMNEWLDNQDNHVGTPNQNFAREFLELFTIGTHDLLTGQANYSEAGIEAATGHLSGFIQDYQPERFIRYQSSLHDTAGRTTFAGVAGAETTSAFTPTSFVDYVLSSHPSASRFLGERLFSQIVHPAPDPGTVEQVAALLRSTNYDLRVVTKQLLKSKAMFSATSKESCINSPVEHVIKLIRRTAIPELLTSGEWATDGFVYLDTVNSIIGGLGQTVLEPPSVFSWKGSCGLNRTGQRSTGEGWLSAQALVGRESACGRYMTRLLAHQFDFTSLLPTNNPTVNEVIDHFSQNLLGIEITPEEKEDLRYFMLHDRSKGSYIQVEPKFTEWYGKRKIPRLLCLIANLPRNSLR